MNGKVYRLNEFEKLEQYLRRKVNVDSVLYFSREELASDWRFLRSTIDKCVFAYIVLKGKQNNKRIAHMHDELVRGINDIDLLHIGHAEGHNITWFLDDLKEIFKEIDDAPIWD